MVSFTFGFILIFSIFSIVFSTPTDIVQISHKDGEISFLIHKNVLLTFDDSSSASAILSNPLFSSQKCNLVNLMGEAVSPNFSMAQLFLHHSDISISCGFWSAAFVPTKKLVSGKRSKKNISIEQIKRQILGIDNAEREYPYDSQTIDAETFESLGEWALGFLLNHWGPLHPYTTYNTSEDSGVYDMQTGNTIPANSPYPNLAKKVSLRGSASLEPVRIALAADWGAGTFESDLVAQQMMAGFDPHYTVHIGDVYFVGTPAQVRSNCLGIPPPGASRGVKWPHGSRGSFAIMGNHEMLSRGYGFFDDFLPSLGRCDPATGKPLGQRAPFFALMSDHWRVVALDTGYRSYSPLLENDDNSQPDEVMSWLNDTLRLWDPADTRGLLFLTHHQYRSAFSSHQNVATAQQLETLLPPGRQVIWLWGHEHRLSFYNLSNAPGSGLMAHGRCVGNGGFPTHETPIPSTARATGLQAYDNRLYTVHPAILGNTSLGFNGFVQLTFTGPNITIEYRTLALDPSASPPLSNTTNTLVAREQWSVDALGNPVLNMLEFNKDLTIVQNM